MANTITIDILANTRGLVNGVNETNNALGKLNNSAHSIIAGFKRLGAAIGLTVGVNEIKNAIKDLAAEEKAFAALEELYGADFKAISDKIGNLSKIFFVDDGDIAQLVLKLRGSLKAELDPLADEFAEAAIVLSKITNKPLEEISAKLVKALTDGKLTVVEIQRLGIHLSEEQQKAFDAAQKSGKGLEYLLSVILSEENRRKARALITPWEKLAWTFNELKDKAVGPLLKAFEKMFDFFTDEDENGIVKVNDNFLIMRDLMVTLATAIAASKLIGFLHGFAKANAGLTVTQVALNIAMRANPIGLIITALTVLVGIIIIVVRKWDTIREEFGKVAEVVGGVVLKFIGGLKDLFRKVVDEVKTWPSRIYNAGKDLIIGIWNGIKDMGQWIRDKISGFFKNNVLGTVKRLFGIGSPSKVFAGYGKNLMQGLSRGINQNAGLAVKSLSGLNIEPSFAFGSSSRGSINNYVTINAGVGTDPYELGRVVSAALDKYSGVNGR